MGAYRFQLADARANIGIRNVAGKCASSDEFVDLVNRATRRLLKRGAWWGTEVVSKLCVHGCDIVWPRYIGTVEGIRFCCAGQADIKNNWYSILGPVGHGTGYGYNWYTDITVFDAGTSPVFNQITGNEGKFLRYQIVKSQDIGKKITFYGKQFGGQPLQELNTATPPAWKMGLTLPAVVPIAQTTTLVTEIKEIVMEPTEGMKYVYQYDPISTNLLMLGSYEPNETNPQYRRSRIQNLQRIPVKPDANGVKNYQIEVMSKLEYIEVQNDRDFLIIDDWDALTFAIQSIRFDEANDPANAETYINKAIRELNFESRTKNPAQQFVVKARVMGSDRIVTNPI